MAAYAIDTVHNIGNDRSFRSRSPVEREKKKIREQRHRCGAKRILLLFTFVCRSCYVSFLLFNSLAFVSLFVLFHFYSSVFCYIFFFGLSFVVQYKFTLLLKVMNCVSVLWHGNAMVIKCAQMRSSASRMQLPLFLARIAIWTILVSIWQSPQCNQY